MPNNDLLSMTGWLEAILSWLTHGESTVEIYHPLVIPRVLIFCGLLGTLPKPVPNHYEYTALATPSAKPVVTGIQDT